MDLEYYSRLFMRPEQLLRKYLLLEHNFGPKSYKSLLKIAISKLHYG